MTRTMAYEALVEEVRLLRNRAYDLETAARSYKDYAEELLNIPTKGALSDQVVRDLVIYAQQRGERCSNSAAEFHKRAATMESEGIR